MDELLSQFLIEARELITSAVDELEAFRADPRNRKSLDGAFRAFHTLKGSVALFDMQPAGRVLHAGEEMLQQLRKGGLPLDDAKRQALVGSLDRLDAWVDALEREGRLPESASAEADVLLRRLHAEQPAPLISRKPSSDWLPALLAHDFKAAVSQIDSFAAFRYEPDSECFFRGDDPLAIVATVPHLVAVKISPRDTWPDLGSLEPFRCYLVIEGVAASRPEDVALAFRLVSDQVEIAAVSEDAPALGEAAATNVERSIRVRADRIEALADGVGELVVAGAALASMISETARLDESLGARFREVQASLERGVSHVNRAVTEIRMAPIGPAVRRLPRIAREAADALGRQVDFAMEGDSVECDKSIADAIYEPLLHLIRNAVDHGVEAPARRANLGKPPVGKIRLRFSRAGDHLNFELEDDGAGIDPQRVRRVAMERRLLSGEEAQALSDQAAQALVFAPGFSTSSGVTAHSGRGVGMDAVKAAIDRLGGRVELQSEVDVGTVVRATLPLSVITKRMLVVKAAGDLYAFPFDDIVETVVVASDGILPLGDHEAIVLRDRTVPVLHLRELLGESRIVGPSTKLMVAISGSERIAIAVDDFGERIDGVVRPVSGLLANVPGISGTTLRSNGSVMLILDLGGLMK